MERSTLCASNAKEFVKKYKKIDGTVSFLRPRPRKRAAGLAERRRVFVAGSSFRGKGMFFGGQNTARTAQPRTRRQSIIICTSNAEKIM